jgi:amino acid transporter
MNQKTNSEPKMVRAVSRWELVGLAFNDVIGSGIYLLPAAAAALLGVLSIGAIIIAGIAVGLLVLCFAEASSYFDEPGGGYLYTREAFGDFIGFEVGWMTWIARVASVAALSAGFALAFGFIWPAAAEVWHLGTIDFLGMQIDLALPSWERALVIIGLLILLAWVNVVGVKPGARVAVGLTIAKSIPLLLFIGIGFFFIDWNSLGAVALPEVSTLGEAALLLLFAYAGFENTPAAAGEYKNPQRDVPFALIVMIICVTLMYALVQLVAVGTFPGLAESTQPLTDAALVFLGGFGAVLMAVGAIISIGGNAGNTTLIGPRYLFALSKDGYGPKKMEEIHPDYKTPAAAIITQTALALVLALTGSFVQLAMLSIIARMSTYVGTAVAVPFLRRRFGDQPNSIQLPGGYAIPIAALVICAGLLASTTTANLIAGAIALLIGALIYYFRRDESKSEVMDYNML